MKKRYVIAGLLITGSIIGQTPWYKESERQSAIRRERIVAKSKAAAAERKAAQEAQFVISAGQRTRCRQLIQRAMHNPSSFRWEGSMSDMRRTGVLIYSGTNAFGGRVRETYKCA